MTLGRNTLKNEPADIQFQAATSYGFDALTQSEARYILNYEPADKLRDRFVAEGRRAREAGDSQAVETATSGMAVSIDVLKAYRTRLKKAGKLREVKTVERCIVLVRGCVGNFGEKQAIQANPAGHAKDSPQ